ncbi:hypothetical protein JW968_00880 [Candidatus Woesearchaeota archaeon]|nr:hypothetical protein [Candidatus Woesearchaeota archaeon]
MKLNAKRLTQKVYEIIQKEWPIHPSGVCRTLGLETTVSNISKIKYHFDMLAKQSKIRTKKLDRALVAWPTQIEKLRVMHELMREEHE